MVPRRYWEEPTSSGCRSEPGTSNRGPERVSTHDPIELS
jgi:hypothetical protein